MVTRDSSNDADAVHPPMDDVVATRARLVDRFGGRLTPEDARSLVDADPVRLVELLGAAGLTTAETVEVLVSEELDALTVSTVLPTIGLSTADSLRLLHHVWDVPNVIAAELLQATAAEMRAGGCSGAEILETRPVEVLPELPADPRVWELAAGSMATAGYSTDEIIDHLAAHAPSPEAFTLGLLIVVDEEEALTSAAGRGVGPHLLAAVSEAVGLSPADTGWALRPICSSDVIVDVLVERCDGDSATAAEIAAACNVGASASRVASVSALDAEILVLLDRLPPPGASSVDDPMRALDTLAVTDSRL